MLKDVVLGQYIPTNSFIHQLDPRGKIIAIGIMMVGVFLLESVTSFALWFVWLAFLIIMTKIPPLFLIRGVKPIWFIILFTMIIHFFMTPGEVVFQLGPLTITEEGLNRGIIIGIRIFVLVLITSMLTLTTSPLELTEGIEALLKPFKRIGVPAHELAMMMTIALRFIPTLLEETERTMKAQMARGMDFGKGSIVQRLKNIIPLMVPLFVSAFRRADELALAMEARCYRGGEGRTRMKQLQFLPKDKLAIAAVVTVTAIAIIIR
ncbi:MAG: energy-coupling factor transporter transmembrane component T [Bacillota bacterium]|nr:energy-coupling factor transporter transmembrane component T [Bacillota bacterium]